MPRRSWEEGMFSGLKFCMQSITDSYKRYDKLIEGYDGGTSDGRLVQIKATFKDSLTFTKTPNYYGLEG